MGYVDLTSAYDSAGRTVLWTVLPRSDMLPRMLTVIHNPTMIAEHAYGWVMASARRREGFRQ